MSGRVIVETKVVIVSRRSRQFTLRYQHGRKVGRHCGRRHRKDVRDIVCLEDSKDPLVLPCGHSFCDECLDGWRSRYGVGEEMRRKCPTCRAKIPPSKEMVVLLLSCREKKQELEDRNEACSADYQIISRALQVAEERIGADWDGVTVLQDTCGKPAPMVMPDYIEKAIAVRKHEISSRVDRCRSNGRSCQCESQY